MHVTVPSARCSYFVITSLSHWTFYLQNIVHQLLVCEHRLCVVPQRGESLWYGRVSSSKKFFLTFKFFSGALQYSNSAFVTIHVGTHSHFTYSRSSAFSLHHHIVRCHVRLKRHKTGDTTAVQEAQLRSVIQGPFIDSNLTGMATQSAPSYRSHDTNRIATSSIVLERKF